MREESLRRLHTLATCARRQGCAELAQEVEALLAAAASLVDPPPCVRCDGETARPESGFAGARLRLSFGYGSRFDLALWRAVLCDDCCQELKDWLEAGAGRGLEVRLVD